MTDETQSASAFGSHMARIAVGSYDGAQDVRTATMNRVRDVVRKRNEGIPFDVVEDEKEDLGDRGEYADENLPELIDEMLTRGKIDANEAAYLEMMLEIAATAEEIEEKSKKVMEVVESEPIYREWIEHVYGISTTLTARLIHKFGYNEDRDRVSQLWAYAGLAPGQERNRGEKTGFDPEAKTLAWLCADNMIRQGSNSRYRVEFYEPYKAEQVRRMEESVCRYCDEPSNEHEWVSDGGECPEGIGTPYLSDFHVPDAPDEATPPKSQGHADARARRYLAKKFLKHYWWNSRDLMGLDTPDEWVITHGGHDKRTDTFENPAHARRVLKG